MSDENPAPPTPPAAVPSDLIRNRENLRVRLEGLVSRLEGTAPVDLARFRVAIYGYSILLNYLNASRDDDLQARVERIEQKISEGKR